MARLLLFEQRAMDRTSALIPGTGSSDFWRATGPNESLANLVTALRQDLVQTPVRGLKIICHGNSGHLEFTRDGLHRGNVSALNPLRGLIGGTVELHGCAVASAQHIEVIRVQGIGNIHRDEATPGSLETGWGPTIAEMLRTTRELDNAAGRVIRSCAGVQFLMAFSNALQLSVIGAIHAQMPDREWQYEGPTVTAHPYGALSLHIPQGDQTFGPNLQGDYAIPF